MSIDFITAKAELRRATITKWQQTTPENGLSREIYTTRSLPAATKAAELGLSREERRTLSQLRARGHHCPLMEAYRYRIGASTSAACPHCEKGEEEDLQHLLLDCPRHHRHRAQLFDGKDPTLRVLTDDPFGVANFLLRKSGLFGRNM